ncbi:probable LRR receptor-like serine/threonine-protein kinase At4g37250 isoform X1 [Lycium barbarum]|uniref:probable LRR receptor-like serine/threonine-protein kinase At4g37250 isoform X1 n=1 Tax=Lycium barbarum TaxID=112863 RepID=UPI00293EA42C|nr:probable LRR receptor-like serine/threonine-protein kinase At4g37250 isoform X1 [Lycium barbarum]
MKFQIFDLHLWWRRILFLLFLFRFQANGLNTDGVLLLTFKYNILSDPLGVLQNWYSWVETPCSWTGVTCGSPNASDPNLRVTTLSLPNSQLLGSIPSSLGMIQYLTNLDLSNNSINGSIPLTLFSAPELQRLDFSNNRISGELPERVGNLKNLQFLNLSGNALAGSLPANLTSLNNLTVVSLKDNYFFGGVPVGFDSVEVLDLSSNLINGSLPPNFGGSNLRYFNVSFNRLSGDIPPEFASKIPPNATLDLSYNNFSGAIPESSLFVNQSRKAFSGNPELCGEPLKNLCPIPSTITTLPNSPEPTSSPAIAAIPKTIDSKAASPNGSSKKGKNGLRTGTIIGIIAGDIAAVGVLALIFMYVYRAKKRKKSLESSIKQEAETAKDFDWASSASSEEYNWLRSWTCLRKQRHGDGDELSENSNSESEESEKSQLAHLNHVQTEQKTGELVTVDGERELELETLLKASAYILGASGSSIMYKAVLEDGTTLAVRRIGESGVERFKDFENQVKVIAKLVHPNLVKIRGFYWGAEEKLVIYDFVPNGSLANARYRKAGSSPCHVPWEIRLKIAKGVARGLTYIHEKKHVHGNLKPSNILLGADMEPKIGDFGIERLVTGDSSHKTYGSARNFGSKRSTASRDSFQDFASGPTPSPSPSALGISPYHAPESLRSLKPNPKWDVFSFGVVLLELLTGKVIVSDEMGPAAAIGAATSAVEETSKVLRLADVAIRADVEGKEDALLALMKVGYSCISPTPHKRPGMREVVQALEKFPTNSTHSSYYYGP